MNELISNRSLEEENNKKKKKYPTNSQNSECKHNTLNSDNNIIIKIKVFDVIYIQK